MNKETSTITKLRKKMQAVNKSIPITDEIVSPDVMDDEPMTQSKAFLKFREVIN